MKLSRKLTFLILIGAALAAGATSALGRGSSSRNLPTPADDQFVAHEARDEDEPTPQDGSTIGGEETEVILEVEKRENEPAEAETAASDGGSDVGALAEENRSLTEQRDKLMEQLVESGRTIRELKKERNANDGVRLAQGNDEASNQELDHLRAKLAVARDEILKLRGQLDQERVRAADRDDMRRTLERTTENIALLEQKAAAVEGLRTKLSQASNRISRLEERNETLETALDDAKGKVTLIDRAHAESLEIAKREAEKLKSDLSVAVTALKERGKRKAELESKLSELEPKLEKAQADRDHYHSRSTELESLVSQRSRELSDARIQAKNLSTKLRVSEEKSSALELKSVQLTKVQGEAVQCKQELAVSNRQAVRALDLEKEMTAAKSDAVRSKNQLLLCQTERAALVSGTPNSAQVQPVAAAPIPQPAARVPMPVPVRVEEEFLDDDLKVVPGPGSALDRGRSRTNAVPASGSPQKRALKVTEKNSELIPFGGTKRQANPASRAQFAPRPSQPAGSAGFEDDSSAFESLKDGLNGAQESGQ